MTVAVMTQSQEKPAFFTLFVLLGKNSPSRFGGTPINYPWVDSSTVTVSYSDSPNAQFCRL